MLALWIGSLLVAPPEVRDFEFAPPDSTVRYAARLTIPEQHNGSAVLLIGGGTAFDLHWTVEGTITSEGHTLPVSIDGSDSHDADVLTAALVERGLIVMQWSLIHTDDVIKDGMLSDPLPYSQSVPVARAALTALRSQPEVARDRIILLGHSLGATRAFQIADDEILGIASLAGAYLDRTLTPPRTIAANEWKAFEPADADAEGSLSSVEFAAAAESLPGVPFEKVDLDDDGSARPWELAAAVWKARIAAGNSPLDDRPEFRPGLSWPVDVLIARPGLSVLLIGGGLDDLSFHAALIEGRSLPNVRVQYFADRGHMLGPEREHRFGPMSPDVIEAAAKWARAVADQGADARNAHPTLDDASGSAGR